MTHDEFAAVLASDFKLFSLAVSGLYLHMRAAGATVTPRGVHDFRRSGINAATAFVGSVNRSTSLLMSGASENLGDAGKKAMAVAMTGVSGKMSGYAGQVIDDLSRKLSSQGLGTHLGVRDAHGGMGELVQRRMGEPSIVLRDASGRRWPGEKLVATDARHFAYQAVLRGKLADIAQQSDFVRLVYPDVSHAYHGQVLSISGAAGYPAVTRNWEILFHHNSSADIEAYVHSE